MRTAVLRSLPFSKVIHTDGFFLRFSIRGFVSCSIRQPYMGPQNIDSWVFVARVVLGLSRRGLDCGETSGEVAIGTASTNG